jgi:prepilin-type N-terminal cleavage/methylation domain-containing protein
MVFILPNIMKLFPIHKQLRAFTLLELLVGMILSGIVLTATFSAYHIITGQYETYRDKSEFDAEVSFFVSQLQSDFSNAKEITRISESEICFSYEKRMLHYKFSEKQVLRTDFLRTDTFHVSVSAIETFLKSEKINSVDFPIDEVHVRMNIDGKKSEKVYLKTSIAKSEIDQAENEMIENGN